MSTTSIGPGPEEGGNESHLNVDHMGNKTLGEEAHQPEAGWVTEAAPQATSGKPKRGSAEAAGTEPTHAEPGPSLQPSPHKLEADRDKVPKR